MHKRSRYLESLFPRTSIFQWDMMPTETEDPDVLQDTYGNLPALTNVGDALDLEVKNFKQGISGATQLKIASPASDPLLPGGEDFMVEFSLDPHTTQANNKVIISHGVNLTNGWRVSISNTLGLLFRSHWDGGRQASVFGQFAMHGRQHFIVLYDFSNMTQTLFVNSVQVDQDAGASPMVEASTAFSIWADSSGNNKSQGEMSFLREVHLGTNGLDDITVQDLVDQLYSENVVRERVLRYNG